MPGQEPLLEQGIRAAKAGDKAEARALLSRAVRRRPESEAAWLWLSSVMDTPQGKAHCLRQVLALNPENRAAQRGLAALEKAAPARRLVAQEAAPAGAGSAETVAPPRRVVRVRPGPAGRQRFWQVVVALLAVVALGMVGVLAYAALGNPGEREEPIHLADLPPTGTPGARGTLRPTFTPSPTSTPTPTKTPTPTLTPTDTQMPTPTDTPTPMPTATRQPQRRVATPTGTPIPRPTLPPRYWDSRLTELGVRIEPAFVSEGQPYWRLVEARWADEAESDGKHSIFVEVVDVQGRRAVGQPVLIQWTDGNVALLVEDRPPPDWGVNFGMYNTLGSYAVSVGGRRSDRIVGLGLGTAEAPNFTIHTSFYLTFRLAYR
jgi:hypothetical protein